MGLDCAADHDGYGFAFDDLGSELTVFFFSGNWRDLAANVGAR